ncbi:MAG: hypothetical protein IPF99_30325 [Deltaproteobacteria bacterium]|nr:hypothetical protein [Deltaproteobacteria bacterium]
MRTALDQAVAGGAEWIVFPGWTLVGTSPPAWLLEASKERTIVCECLHPDWTADKEVRVPRETVGKERRTPLGAADRVADDKLRAPEPPVWPAWTTYVLKGGRAAIEATQRFARADDRDAGSPALLGDLSAGSRSNGDSILWICGEVELLSGGGGHPDGGANRVRNTTGHPDSLLRGGGIVLNPSHTRAGPQASRDKRAWLSHKGWLLNTANTHAGGWTFWKFDNEDQPLRPLTARASHRAAAAWRRGSRLEGKRRVTVEPIQGLTGSASIKWVEMN